MSLGNVWTLAQKELQDALRNRWFAVIALAFAGLALAVAWLGLAGLGGYRLGGFGRTTASLVNLVVLVVPLMGLTLGALALAPERERGTLLYLLSQPVTHVEVLLGKFLGLGLTLLGALALGFGASGLLLAARGGLADAGGYLALAALAFLLALASLSLGLLISAATRRGAAAVGAAVALWFFLAVLSDLGLMGTALALDLGPQSMFVLTLLNPLQDFRIAAILVLRNSLEVLGPAGTYAERTYGAAVGPLLVGALFAWTAASTAAAVLVVRRRAGV